VGIQAESTKKSTCKYCIERGKRTFLKRARKILDNLKKDEFTAVSTNESFFFFYDSLVRKVWIDKDERPILKLSDHTRNQFCLMPQT
jgi:hypothetical protein